MSRRTKWHPTPPPPPSPKVLHFPRRRRTRRRNPLLLMNQKYLSLKGNLESLFDQENHQPHLELLKRRERVEERVEEEDCGGGLAAEKWRFQAEMLRAECNLLRMEREFTLNKLEKNRVKMETTLRSALQTLLSGRKKMVEGKSANAVLEEEIEDLVEKLDELQKNSRIKGSDVESCSNFDSKAHSSFSDCKNDNNEAMNKCSGRCKAVVLRIVEQVRAETEQWSQMQKMLEHVRGDMEELQASRDYWETRAHNSDCEIQSLRHAVEEWKDKALYYEKEVNELQSKLSVAKQKMQKSKLDENNMVPLGAQLVKERLALKTDLFPEEKGTPKKELAPLSLAKQLAREKRSLHHGLKENRLAIQDKQELREEDGRSRRYSNIYGAPLREIGNASPLARQKHRAAFDYHSPERSRIRESFRK